MSNLINDTVNREAKKRNKFVKRVASLIDYSRKNGTIANIKQNEIYQFEGQNVKIGLLISNLRRDKKDGRLSEDDIVFLDYLGMNWGYNFERIIKLLTPYYSKHGTMENLTQYHKELGNLLTYLRVEYRNNNLTIKEVSRLEEMGIVWSPNHIDNVLAGLRAYYHLHGTISDVQANDSIIINNKVYNIGKQIAHFRNKRKCGKLKQEYIKALDKMGMSWGRSHNNFIKEDNEREF